MGKLIYAMCILFVLQFSAFLFLGVDLPGTSLYAAIMGATEWSSLSYIDYLNGALLAIGVVGLVAGLYIVRSDFVFYASLAAIFITFGQVYYEMYQKIVGVTNAHGIPNQIIMFLFVPLILPWTFILLDWIRGRD
jgi:hypothetical protein